VGNTRLLHTISQQLGVPLAEAKDVAESMLGVTLICTLGGEYQLQSEPDGRPYWVSTHWPELQQRGQDATAEYTSPLLQWFRGLEADVVMLNDRVIAYAALDMQRQPKKPQNELKLPLFDLFRDNPFKRADKEVPPPEDEPFEELPPPLPEPRGR
jgi:hypothetical protein